jgi:hypothetical protein
MSGLGNRGIVEYAKGKGKGNQKGMEEFERGSTEEARNELAREGKISTQISLAAGFSG